MQSVSTSIDTAGARIPASAVGAGRCAFRADIEGLRGIAVLAVVTYHAAPTLMPGGFLGVDIFFVLSGYLITRLLLRELNATGRLDVVSFWARRIRRIAPVAAITLLAIAIASFVIPDFDGRRLGRHFVAAALSYYNWHQISHSVDYLAQEGTDNPVLHYWSLSVEEQFYFVWPFVLLLLVLCCRWWRPAIVAVVGGLIAVSLVGAVLLAPLDQPLAFFGTGTRAWQLLAGALVALIPAASDAGGRRTVLSVLGAVLLGVALAGARGAVYEPSYSAAATLGTLLLICAPVAPLSALLALPALSYVGRISYSLYMVHWPLLVFFPATLEWRAAALVVGFLFAAASFRFIEQPVRNSRTLQRSHALTYLLGVVLVVSAAGAGAALLKYGPNLQPEIYKDGCLLSHEDVAYADCAYGKIDSVRTVVLFGDSHAGNWFNALEAAARRQNWRLVVRVKASCSPIERLQRRLDGRDYTECAVWRRNVLAELKHDRPDLVVVGSARAGSREEEQAVLRSLAALAPTIAMQDTPRLPRPAPRCLRSKDASGCRWPLRQLVTGQVYPASASAGLPAGVRLLNLNEKLCPNGVCAAALDGRPVMFDERHLTESFSAGLAPVFEALLRTR